jgi:hypothetical protein
MIIGMLLWPKLTLQSTSFQNLSSLSECTLSPAINELLYAPSVCNEEWFGCPAQTWLALNGVPFDSALWTIAHVTGI